MPLQSDFFIYIALDIKDRTLLYFYHRVKILTRTYVSYAPLPEKIICLNKIMSVAESRKLRRGGGQVNMKYKLPCTAAIFFFGPIFLLARGGGAHGPPWPPPPGSATEYSQRV